MTDIDDPKDRVPEGGTKIMPNPEDILEETGLKATEASSVDAVPEEEEVVRSEEKLSLRNVESLLKKAARRNESVIISGRTIENPAQALENLSAALAIVKKHLKVDKSSLFFTSFTGTTSGEATEDSEYIDALQLMHPAERLAHNIGHEVAHMKGDVDCEGLVESYLRAVGLVQNEGDAIETTKKYDVMLEQFNDFAERARGKMGMAAFVKKIYKLYYNGEYEKIFKFYDNNFIKVEEKRMIRKRVEENPREAKLQEYFKLFEGAFPELVYNIDGEFVQIPILEEEHDSEDVVSNARNGVTERGKEFDETT